MQSLTLIISSTFQRSPCMGLSKQSLVGQQTRLTPKTETTREALTRGGTNYFSNIFPAMTQNFNLGPWPMNMTQRGQDEPPRHTPRSKVISFESCLDIHTRTQKHTHTIDWLLYMATKVVNNEPNNSLMRPWFSRLFLQPANGSV